MFDKIIKVFEDNIERIRNEVLNFIRNDNKEENKEILNSIINLFNKE